MNTWLWPVLAEMLIAEVEILGWVHPIQGPSNEGALWAAGMGMGLGVPGRP